MNNTTNTIQFKLNKNILDITGDKDFTYTAIINGDKVKVSWRENGHNQFANYTVEEMNKYFQVGDWIKVER
jgi:hypothetical protein